MNREKDELVPFQADVNVDLFFPGAQRRELLDEVKNSIADGVAVLSIIGDEGTGKSMLCRMIEKELSNRHICVYLPENLESFDEVARILAIESGVGEIDQSQSLEETVSAIIDTLKERDQRLVVIFDQAERMYLAMLERLRKLLDRINTRENLLQVIFAGRKVLLENLDQLAICDFADAAETHFYLDYLDVSETYAYLNHCARQRSRAKGKSIFTPEASKKIYAIARGNLKTTNILAAQSIESADNEGSFVVAPGNVNIEDSGLEILHESFLAGVRRRSGRLIAGALILVIGVLLIAFFRDGDKNERSSLQQPEKPLEISVGTEQGTESLSPSTEQTNSDIPEEEISESSINHSSIVFKTEAEQPGEQQEETLIPLDQSGLNTNVSDEIVSSSNNANEKTASKLQSKEVPGAGVDKAKTALQAQPSESGAAGQSQRASELQHDKTVAANQTDSHLKVSGLSVKDEVDSTLIPGNKQEEQGSITTPEQIKKQEKKILTEAGKQAEQEQQEVSTVLAGNKKSMPNQLQSTGAPKQLFKVANVKLPKAGTAAPEKAKQQPAVSESNLYEQRVAAGKLLLSGKIEGTQTIQVMALSGEQAEKNLRERFSRQSYREIADKLYILESNNRSTFFVYYGTFADRESADKAKEHLPPFLGKNEPYVISLLEAQSKITP